MIFFKRTLVLLNALFSFSIFLNVCKWWQFLHRISVFLALDMHYDSLFQIFLPILLHTTLQISLFYQCVICVMSLYCVYKYQQLTKIFIPTSEFLMQSVFCVFRYVSSLELGLSLFLCSVWCPEYCWCSVRGIWLYLKLLFLQRSLQRPGYKDM